MNITILEKIAPSKGYQTTCLWKGHGKWGGGGMGLGSSLLNIQITQFFSGKSFM